MARIYPAEFRRDAVALVRSSDKTVTQVARELGLNRETLRQWVKQDRIDQGEAEGLTTGERDELRRLRREVAERRMERELLVKAAAFLPRRRPGDPLPVPPRQPGRVWRAAVLPGGGRLPSQLLRLAPPWPQRPRPSRPAAASPHPPHPP
jgi:transposase